MELIPDYEGGQALAGLSNSLRNDLYTKRLIQMDRDASNVEQRAATIQTAERDRLLEIATESQTGLRAEVTQLITSVTESLSALQERVGLLQESHNDLLTAVGVLYDALADLNSRVPSDATGTGADQWRSR